MKANELMIGDLVLLFGKAPSRVTAIEDLEVYVYEEERGDWNVGYEHINPIPLTPEILEKNGFKQDPKSRSRKSHQIITNDVYISWWKGRLNILYKPFVGHSTNHINCDGKYVHELQHALRLAGIEKEIVL